MPKTPRTMGDLGSFPTTRWTLVQAIGSSDAESRRELLSDFFERYRPALAAHLAYEFRDLKHEDRADVLQSFIVDKVISNKLLDHAAESRGRLRSYLKTSLNNYTIDWLRSAQNRFHRSTIPLDTHQHDAGHYSNHTETFEVAWAKEVIHETIARFRKDVQARRRDTLWLVFEHRLLKPAIEGAAPTPIEKLCQMVDAPPKRVYNLVITARRNFSRHLKEVVSEYATDERDVDNEIRDLMGHLYLGDTNEV